MVLKGSTCNYREIQMLPRDWELLYFIEEQGFVSFSQICKKFFHGNSSYCSRRLKKMCFFKYLEKKSFLDFFGCKNGTKHKYFPHLLNLNIRPQQQIYFVGREYAKGFGKSGQIFKPSMILHQLILNDIRVYLEEQVVHKWSLNDPKLKILSYVEHSRNEDIVPDLSLEYDSVRLAIEVERTPKGKIRYFKRFNFFRESIYSHIIYYYTDECQLRPLLERAGVSRKFAFAHYKTPNELYSNVFGLIDLHTFIHRVLD